MFDESQYQMIPEETRHEMKQIATIIGYVLKKERKAEHQVLLRKAIIRSFDLIEKLNDENMELRCLNE